MLKENINVMAVNCSCLQAKKQPYCYQLTKSGGKSSWNCLLSLENMNNDEGWFY